MLYVSIITFGRPLPRTVYRCRSVRKILRRFLQFLQTVTRIYKKKQKFEINMSDGKGGKTPMTQDAASRIQSSQAKQHGGQTEKGSFPARAQAAAAKNAKK